MFSDVIAFYSEHGSKSCNRFCGWNKEVLCIKVGGIHTYHHVIVTGIRLEDLTKKVFFKIVSKNVEFKTGLLESVNQFTAYAN